MNIKEINVEGLAREVQITIAATDLAKQLDDKIESVKGQVQIKGFRPGKVPAAHVRKTFGEQLMGEIIQETVNTSSQKMLTDREERPAMQPEIKLVGEVDAIVAGTADLVYDIKYEIIPPITLTDFSKLKLEKPTVEVDDARVQEALERLASSRKEYVARKKTAKAQNGDRVKIDFLGRIDGEAFEGGAGEGFDLELGSGQFIPGFEEQLVGTKAGDKIDVSVDFPADYGSADLAGKAAVFECTVHEVSEPKDAQISEEFASSLGMESLDKLKEAMREQIGADYSQMSRGHLKKDLLDQLADTHDFDLPPSMVELEFEQIWGQFQQELTSQEKTIEDLDESEDDLRAEYRGIAVRRVRTGLVLAEVGNNNAIEVSQEELNQGLMQRVQQFPGQEQQVFEYFQKNPEAMGQIRAPLFEEKVVDFICEMATVSDKKVSLEELMVEPGADSQDKPKAKKPAAKKAPAKKAPAKKAEAKKPAAKKPAAKKSAKKAADKK
ncbi:MAG: trigger factor [Rhodobiaceae bacterium]|jgi:trigger factor|nr:trigger factor [Rhodobiaceae bacterium]MBT5518614.1 trigger factor [Rhodobiaceae bacterium]MBT7280011.1 trigger factor [Rhodobiaceae bacterium]